MKKCFGVRYLSREIGDAMGISDFPNFSETGSIVGMKQRYYGYDALLIHCGHYIYYVGNGKSSNPDNYSRGENLYFNCAIPKR